MFGFRAHGILKNSAISWQRCANRLARSRVCRMRGEVVENAAMTVYRLRLDVRMYDSIKYTTNRLAARWHTVTVSELIECNNLKTEHHASSCSPVGSEETTRRSKRQGGKVAHQYIGTTENKTKHTTTLTKIAAEASRNTRNRTDVNRRRQ